jgi:hypothetical protein
LLKLNHGGDIIGFTMSDFQVQVDISNIKKMIERLEKKYTISKQKPFQMLEIGQMKIKK